MTVTENGRRPARTREDLLAQARDLIGSGPLPSKESLRKSLKTRFDTASEVYDTLFRERADRRSNRLRRTRVQLAKARRATRLGRPRIAAFAPLPNLAPVIEMPPVEPVIEALPDPAPTPVAEGASVAFREEIVQAADTTVPAPSQKRRKPVATWPIFLLALPAFVAIWSGWVDLGRLTGFGVVHPFPGIPKLQEFALNTAITLPIGLETYAAYALYVWLSGQVPAIATKFAKWSAIGSLALGALGQIAYHLMSAAGWVRAPWWITTIVACLPVAVLGMGAALRHLVNVDQEA